MAKNYYDILGVSRQADSQTIRKAFRRLAKKYHPDINKSASAIDKFHKIKEAYEVLKDEKRRKAYDKSLDQSIRPEDLAADIEQIKNYIAWQRKKRKEKQERIRQKENALFKYVIKVLFLPALFVILGILGVYIYDNYQKKKVLQNKGIPTVGHIQAVNSGFIGPAYAQYVYKVHGKWYSGTIQLSLKMDATPVGENGMPVHPGDKFKVLYVQDNPSNSKVLLQHPTQEQLKRYHQMAKDKCVSVRSSEQKEMGKLIQFCDCLVERVYQHKGIDGYADIYFQDVSFARNASHNRRTYKKLMRNITIKTEARQCRQRYLNN